ncbi:glycosyl hydrolase family 26 [Labedella gwakjiensis]|uniref:Glycosyl hydrolase family 26 n=1 Tax=Labedella gwakjiensis TaxID=390269 RepID=A0A2P8GZK9_9MICO|nr:glycosyl hydrolase [Labedella gwakjiensis]PSL39411.1 glycosyl hydrolase family 26 [Labedella gwakjiensis]
MASIAFVTALSIMTYVVWMSPGGKSTVQAIQEALSPTHLQMENAQLTATVSGLEKKVADLESTVASQADRVDALLAEQLEQQASYTAQLAEAQQQLVDVQTQLDQANVALDAARSSGSSGGSGQGSGGSVTPAPTEPGDGNGSEEPTLTAPSLSSILDPDYRYVGMYTEQAPFNWATFDSTATKIGASPNLVGYFGGWDEDFRANAVTRAWEQERVPMLTWESRPIDSKNDVIDEPEYSLPVIIEGGFDDYLRQYARDIVATGLPLVIRLDHEMNGVWYPWNEVTSKGASINGNSRGDYVKMWRHVHDIFEEEGANEYVGWLWAPNIVNNLPSLQKDPAFLESLYPGDEYVDWVGLSGYLRPAYKPGQEFTFEYTFGESLDQVRALSDKPILLAEVGASETGGHKPTWVKSFFEAFTDEANSDVIGFAWFNLAVTTYVEGERTTNDWRIDSRADSLLAFTTGLSDPLADFRLVPTGE